MTIYHYVRTKDELLALMHDALAGEIVVTDRPLPKQWRAAVTLIARTTRAVFIRHPKLLNALGGIRLGPNVMRHVEQSFAAVANAPCSEAEKQIILAVVDDFVFGSLL